MRRMWKSTGLATAVGLSMLYASRALRRGHAWSARLVGPRVVPPVQTRAHGAVELHANRDAGELTYKVMLNNIENVRAVHLHQATPGENGEIVANLYVGPKIEGRFDGVLAEGRLTDFELRGPLSGKRLADLAGEIRAARIYANVHTDQHPNGELRGQLH